MARSLDLAALRSFVAIVETGGVTKAAARLHLTQSAVSMQLKRLEEALGQTLLERARRAMVPTAAGELLLSYARRMIDLNDEVWARMTEPTFEGVVRLGAPHDIVYPHIPDVLRTFAREFPRVRVQLQSSYTHTLKDEFARGELDVILTTERTPTEGAQVLREGALVWIGAPLGSAYRRRPLPLAFEYNCIFRPWVQSALDEADIPWVMAVESMSIRTVEATTAADVAVHAGIADTLPPQLVPIEHGGSLPALPPVSIALYVGGGPEAPLAERLAQIVRREYAHPPSPALAAA